MSAYLRRQRRTLTAHTQKHRAAAVKEGVVDKEALAPCLRVERVEVVKALLGEPGQCVVRRQSRVKVLVFITSVCRFAFN